MPYRPGDLPAARRVVVIAPHPDDEVFGCGGAVARYVADGAEVQPVVLTDGGFGAFGKDVDRESESAAAAVVLGTLVPMFLRIPDRQLRFSDHLVAQLQALLESLQPDVVLATSPWELHPDHVSAAMATAQAVSRLSQQPVLMFYEVSAPLPPSLLIDVSQTIERKAAAGACFASQLALQAYDQHVSALNRFRTYTLPRDVVAAEAFYVVGEADWQLLPSSPYARQLQTLQVSEAWRVNDGQRAKVCIMIRSSSRPELLEALGSIAAQSYPNIEVLVASAIGAGHGAIPERAGSFAVRFLPAEGRLDRVAAANRLLDHADGQYGLFLDDDDWLLPGHIERLVRALEANTAASVAYAGVDCLATDAQGEWSSVRRYDADFDLGRLRVENYLPIHACLFRLDRTRNLRLDPAFDLFEDWDWWLQCSQLGPFVHVPGVSAIYRIHSAGGLGVVADAELAKRALEQVVQKWFVQVDPLWGVETVAYARRLYTSLTTTQQRVERLGKEADLLTNLRQQDAEAYEAEIAGLTTHQIALQHEVELYQQQTHNMEKEIHVLHQRITDTVAVYESTLSWRLSQPLRWLSAMWKR